MTELEAALSDLREICFVLLRELDSSLFWSCSQEDLVSLLKTKYERLNEAKGYLNHLGKREIERLENTIRIVKAETEGQSVILDRIW